MSRIPSNSHYTHQQQQPPPPQPMYYNPGHHQQPPPLHHTQPHPHQLPPPHGHAPPHYQDPGMYHDGSRSMGWDGTGSSTGHYGASGTPSRSDPYAAAYPQPAHRTPPNSRNVSSGWSSVHPVPRPDTANRGPVKLEDLVSTDRRPPTSKAIPQNGPAGLTSLPLSASHSTDGLKMTAAESSAAGAGAGPKEQAGPSEFIKKLYKMLEEESAMFGKGRSKRNEGVPRGSVGWGRGGTSFVVWDMNEFTTKILPQTFRHSNFSSFVRQLNKYGFSKIKHVDDESGQIKENVWEFQHPNFQAGGKSDLDSIKRKTVVPKKAPGDPDTAPSPRGLSGDDINRIADMESRVMGLEDQLSRALEEVREAKSRELGMMNVMREVISHLATIERENNSPPGETEPSHRIVHLFQAFEQVASGPSALPAHMTQMTMPYANQLPIPLHPVRFSAASGSVLSGIPTQQVSPRTDSGSRNGDGPSPAGSRTSHHRGSISQIVPESAVPSIRDETMELPSATTTQPADPNQTLFNGDPLEMTPMFADTPAWLTENTTVPLPIYHRRSTDGAAFKIMMEALQNPVSADGTTDPLDTTPPQLPVTEPLADPTMTVPANIPMPTADVAMTAAAAGTGAAIQQSPFGTLVMPNADQPAAAQPVVDHTAVRIRRSTVIKPHWTQTPRILVVEDDVVYRQLSSKFLEKFGCITETVEDAQGAVEKMNKTKYDLVLMDIFFGPSMDGRKATSLIRQFDIYTPIISMTSNVQTHDVNSYLQSGMNDVLAKPFTKHGLFGILDKHLIHLKAIQLSGQVPRFLGVPPLSDQGVVDAVATGAAQWTEGNAVALRNPLAAMGWSDDTYQLVLSQFMSTGTMPEVNTLTNDAIGTSVVFGDSSGFNRKRSIEAIDDDWTGVANTNMTGIVPADTLIGNGVLAGSDLRESKRVKQESM